MLRSCIFAALCVMMSVSPARGELVENCDDLNWNFTKEVLVKTAEGHIRDISTSHHTGNIYLVIWKPDSLGVIEKENGYTVKNVNISGIRSVAVDNSVPKVYIGGENGLHLYDEVTGVVTNVNQIWYNIWKIYVPMKSEELYVVKKNEGQVYRYRNMLTEEQDLNIEVFFGLEHRFVVDFEGNYFYTTNETDKAVTKIQLNGQTSALTYSDGPFSALAVDNAGRVFGTSPLDYGVFHLNVDGTTELVAKLDFYPYCMNFDENNNALFETENDKVVIFKFDHTCKISSLSPN